MFSSFKFLSSQGPLFTGSYACRAWCPRVLSSQDPTFTGSEVSQVLFSQLSRLQRVYVPRVQCLLSPMSKGPQFPSPWLLFEAFLRPSGDLRWMLNMLTMTTLTYWRSPGDFFDKVTKYMGKWKADLIMEAERKVRGPPHSLWEPQKSVPNFLPV